VVPRQRLFRQFTLPSVRSTDMSDVDPATKVGSVVDRLKGTAKQVAGTVTGDDDLTREGELHKEKARTAVEAAKAGATAEREQAKAQVVAREMEIEVERERLQAEATAEQRAQRAEIERA